MGKPHSASQAVTCPRCGYDQSGLISAWTGNPPLTGTCSECGLEFEWADVLDAERRRLPAFVEHARPQPFGLGLLFSAWRTFLWTLFPARFWGRVKLHHTIRPSRWIVWLLLTIGVVHVINVALWVGVGIAHLKPQLIAKASGVIAWPPRPANATISMGDQVLFHLLDGALRPLATFDGTAITSTKQVVSVTSPPNWTMRVPPNPHSSLVLAQGYWNSALVMLTVPFLFPALLALLSDTRRIAKVRPLHLVRGLIYSCSWIVVLALLRGVRLGNDLLFGPERPISPAPAWAPGGIVPTVPRPFPFSTTTIAAHNGLAIFLIAAWTALWWYFCIRDSLRLPKPGVTWSLLAIAFALAVVSLTVMSNPMILIG